MAVKVDYDTDKRIIYVTLAPVDGLVELDVQVDLYSDMKEDWHSNSTLNKFKLPIRSVGGDPLPGSKTLGDTYFLDSQWKIRPYEADHKLAINGNLFAEDGSSVMIPTIGNYNVLVEMFVSNLSDSSIQQLTEIEYSVYNGGVSVDVVNGLPGQVYDFGTPFNPVDNIADALTIKAAQKLPSVLYLLSDIVLGVESTINDFMLVGHSHVNIDLEILAAALVTDVIIENCYVHGVLDGNNEINNSVIGDLTYLNGHIHGCSLRGTITLGGAMDAYFNECSRLDVDIVPIIDMGGSGQDLVMINYSGAIRIENLTGANKAGIGLDQGTIVLDSATVTGGSITASGVGRMVDENGTPIVSGTWNGGVTVLNELISNASIAKAVWEYTTRALTSFGTLVADIWGYVTRTLTGGIPTAEENADAVWDELLTGATHDVATSAGKRLRMLSDSVIISGTVVSSTANTVKFNGDASTEDGAYDPAMISIVGGAGAGQTRLILQYDGATKTAVVDRNWKANPDATSEYIITGHPGREGVNEGLVQAGGVNTVTLNALASDQDDAYVGQLVFIRSGTGEDQALRVIAYSGVSKIATLCENWAVIPDSTSAYIMLPYIIKGSHIADAVWDKTLP